MSDREKRLDKASSELAALPELLTELESCLTERRPVEGGGHAKVTGSPAPLRLDVLHLVDRRHKPDYDDDWDPRAVADTVSRHGVLTILDQWAHGVVLAQMAEADLDVFTPRRLFAAFADGYTVSTSHLTVPTYVATLQRHWRWITEQQWAGELADTILQLSVQIRAALGQVELRLACPTCSNPAFVDGKWLVCTERHETSLRNLTQQQRRRPAMTTKDIADEFRITQNTIHQWYTKYGKIQPINPGGKPLLWLPWDVFRIVNPDLVAAAEEYDDIPA